VTSYLAVVFCDLVRHSHAWGRVPRGAMVTIISEYRYLAQSIASQYGRRHENFAGDGHLFLFESADAAVHFGLKLLAFWKQRRRALLALQASLELPLRIGCHFGECTLMTENGDWIGRAINLAKRVEDTAMPDSLFVTQSVLELIDLPIYGFEEVGTFSLKGDFLPRRQLYRLISVDQDALVEKPVEELTAGDWFLRGVILAERRAGNPIEEEECYRQALVLRADYPEAHNNLAILLKARGEENAAAKHYQEALRLWPQYAESHYNYAILLETKKDLTGAAAHYREAIQRRPEYVDAHHRYANLLLSCGEEEEAERHYVGALRLRPGSAGAHNNYAILLEHKGELAAADEHYSEALRLHPDYAEAHYNYAMLLEGRHEADKAKKHYRAALRVNPDYAEAHNNLAVLLHSQGDLVGAETHYATALRLRPRDPETNYNFALLAQARGDNQTADRHFRIAYELARKVEGRAALSGAGEQPSPR
jgi:tetratricopeptide (TPR) repeat protein